MSSFHARLWAVSGGDSGGGDDDGFGVFGGVATDACSLVVASCVLAASVVIWEACAFAAMAALLVAGAAWCVTSVVSAGRAGTGGGGGGGSRPAAGARARACGLTELDIRALPSSPYQQRRAAGPEDGAAATCSVCLEDVRAGEMVRSLPECRHLFHVGCIDVWLHSHVTCPLCRSDLSPRRRPVTTPTPAAGAGAQAASPSPQLPAL